MRLWRTKAPDRPDPSPPTGHEGTGAPAGSATSQERPLKHLAWRRILLTFVGCAGAWIVHRLLGGHHALAVWLTVIILGAAWLAAVRMLLLDTAVRRFWVVWLALGAVLIIVAGSDASGYWLGLAFSITFLVFRRYRPYRSLSSARRALLFFMGLLALACAAFGWGFELPSDPQYFHLLGRNFASYALGSLRVFWLMSLLWIFFGMRLHFLHLKPKLAVSALFVALVPLVLVLILAGLTVLGALGGSRAARGHAMLQAWAQQVDRGIDLQPIPFQRVFEADLAGGVTVLRGEGPEWLTSFREQLLQDAVGAGGEEDAGGEGGGEDGAGGEAAGETVADTTGAGSTGADEEVTDRTPSGVQVRFDDEETLIRFWAPRDTTAYFRIGSEIWLLRIEGLLQRRPRVKGLEVDSTALNHLADILRCHTGFYSSQDLMIRGADEADLDVVNDTTRLDIDIRGRHHHQEERARAPAGEGRAPDAGIPAPLPLEAGGRKFWEEDLRIGAALLEVLRPTDEGFSTDQVILHLSASLQDLMQEFTLDEYRLNQVLVFGLLILAAFFLVMEGFALFFGLRIATGITGAVAELHKGTVRLAAGDLDAHIEVPNEDELGELADAFNDMTMAVKRGREEAVTRERLERELETARTIQQRLLPHESPIVPGFEVIGTSVPSLQVGGDYFDFLAQGEGRLGIAIGDVSGKGMPAALLMSNLQASLQGQVIHPSSVAEVVQRVNDLMVRSTDEQMFATFFYGVLDRSAGTFTSTNAGHNPPILCRADGSIELLRRGGLLIGMLPGQSYEQESAVLHEGDVLVLYTDGITEAEGPDGPTPRGSDSGGPSRPATRRRGSAARAGSADGRDQDIGSGSGSGSRSVAVATGGSPEEEQDAQQGETVMLGDERLVEIIRENAHLGAAGIREAIIRAVSEHVAGIPQSDDITLIVIKRQAEPSS